MAARIDHLVTSGTFSLDGGTWEVDNNVWIVGDDDEAIVIDAAHDADAIAAAVGNRRLLAIVSTHGHDDHVDAAPAVSARTGAPVLLHPGDLMLWKQRHPDLNPTGELSDGQVVEVAGIGLRVLHTPGHSPGAVCLYAPDLGTVFSGDTLFAAWAGRHGAVLLRLPDHHHLDPRAAADTPGRDRGPHRSRREHHRRRRGPAPGRVDRPRPLTATAADRPGRADREVRFRFGARRRAGVRIVSPSGGRAAVRLHGCPATREV